VFVSQLIEREARARIKKGSQDYRDFEDALNRATTCCSARLSANFSRWPRKTDLR
jgi:hypothetical protein